MAIKPKYQLKELFESGDLLSEESFNDFIDSSYNPTLIAGAGMNISKVSTPSGDQITLSVVGSGSGGGVSLIQTGNGLSGGPITSTGTLSIKVDGSTIGFNGSGQLVVIGGTSSNEFIYQPGGTAAGNIYTEFEAMMQAVESAPGKKLILFDRTFLASATPITIPVRSGGGSWDFTDCSIDFVFEAFYDGSSNAQVDVAAGNSWVRFPDGFSFVNFTFNNTVDPVVEYSGLGQAEIFFMDSAASISNFGTVEVIRVTNNASFLIGFGEGAQLLNQNYEIVNIINSSTFQPVLLGSGSDIEADTIRGDATADLDVGLSNPEAVYNEQQNNYLGTVDLNSSSASRRMSSLLPNFGSTTFTHNFNNDFVLVQIYNDSGGGFPKPMLGIGTDISVTITSFNDIQVTDISGLGGIGIEAIIQVINNQVQ